MRRILLLVLVVAAAAGFATPSYAFLTPGKVAGTEFALLPAGPGAWQVTLESSEPINSTTIYAGGLNFGIINAVNFVGNPAVCDGVQTICGLSDVGGFGVGRPDTLYFSISQAAGSELGNNVGAPRLLGEAQVPTGNPAFTLDFVADVFGDLNVPPPVDFVNPVVVPEPAAFVFVAMGLGSLALLRRRTA
jgi:hypothetical protein